MDPAEKQDKPTSKEHEDAFAPSRPAVVVRRLFAETFGAFALVTVDCGGAVIANLSGGEVTPAARSVATGLLIMAMVYSVGDVSGAHFNPAVTLGFALRRAFPWRSVPAYWLAQVLGTTLAALLLRATFGNVDHLGATAAHYGWGPAFVIEVFLTALLVFVALGTATRHRVLGANAALAAGGTVALCALFARPISGASMNPARSLGPALVSGELRDLWIYLTAPFVGAVLGTLVVYLVHPRKHASEREAAAGEMKR